MKTLRALYLLLAVSFVGLWTSVALADTVGDPSKDPTTVIAQLWQAIVDKKWGLAAVVATMLLVAFARFISPRIHGPFGAWVNSQRVSAVLALLGGAASAVAAKLMAGGHLTVQVLVAGFTVGVAAIGGYNAFWDIIFPADKKPNGGAQ